MSKPTLLYFPIRGRAENVRLILEAAGVEYEDAAPSDWPSLKPKLAEEGKLPFGQLPTLTMGGKTYAQSHAIVNYLAKKHGLAGNDEEEQYRIDAAVFQCDDWRTGYAQLVYRSADYQGEKPAYLKEKAAHHANLMQNFLKASEDQGNTFLIKGRLTSGDLELWDILDLHVELDKNFLEPFPVLKSYYERVANVENIKKYLQSSRRPQQINGNQNGRSTLVIQCKKEGDHHKNCCSIGKCIAIELWINEFCSMYIINMVHVKEFISDTTQTAVNGTSCRSL
ncbi:glutathione transferase [Planoprotostelium fungivorum]|uniref:glutathione transferase n=1 Tax=Planoprotostelium fungivorum TaxID=1890364 RepID=A0A2P6N0G2_9EUKA|nr:glutathione transferase [Planoprotostelium fungivorum]